MRNEEVGRSMVEMLGVLAIIGVLSIGGIAGYTAAMTSHRVNKMADQIQTMVTQFRALYSNRTKITLLSPEQAYTAGILSDETWNGTNTVNAFEGVINFGKGVIPGKKTEYFSIEYTNIPIKACTSIVTMDWGADNSNGLWRITIEDQAFTLGDKNFPLPVSPQLAGTYCKDPSKIRWDFQ